MPWPRSASSSARQKPPKRSSRRLLRIHGHSMAPALNPGELVVVDEAAYRVRAPRRGEIVAACPSALDGQVLIKRIAALPNQRVTIEGREWQLSCDEFFLLGDRRDDSYDSRAFGPVTRDALIGPIQRRLWPWTRL